MQHARLIGLMFLLLAGGGDAANAADARPDPRIKQLKVLDQFAGSWTGTQPGTKRKAHLESEWILKGRVLQTRATLADGRELLVLRSYDPVLKTYVATVWDSNGLAIVVSGDWDEEHKTLTTAADAGNIKFRAVWQLVDDDTVQWEVRIADANGKPQQQFGGTNHRVKK